MRIGLFQSHSPAGDLPAGLSQVAQAVSQAARDQVDMLVMPEMFLPGYNSDPNVSVPEIAAIRSHLSALCIQHGVGLTIGLPDNDNGTVYNAACVFGADGAELAKFRKIQLFGPRETNLFAPGAQLVVFDYLGTRFGLLICYDVEFAEHVRALARAGAQVILVPTANMKPYINVNQVLVPARAMENAVTIAYANYCGSEGDLDYVGHSLIAGPDGYPLAQAKDAPCLLAADLETGLGPSGIALSTQLDDYRPAKDPVS